VRQQPERRSITSEARWWRVVASEPDEARQQRAAREKARAALPRHARAYARVRGAVQRQPASEARGAPNRRGVGAKAAARIKWRWRARSRTKSTARPKRVYVLAPRTRAAPKESEKPAACQRSGAAYSSARCCRRVVRCAARRGAATARCRHIGSACARLR